MTSALLGALAVLALLVLAYRALIAKGGTGPWIDLRIALYRLVKVLLLLAVVVALVLAWLSGGQGGV